jgi:hypothetical protein
MGIAIFAFVAIAAFWLIWYGVDRDILAAAHTEVYYGFENAFPMADSFMALCAAAVVWSLWQRRAVSFFWCIAGGSMSVYLGALDVLFDLENGIYATRDNLGGVITEILINLLTLLLGAILLVWAWKQRRALAALDGF